MFDLFKIRLWGHQPIAKISDKLLYSLIERDYKCNSDFVKRKFENINCENQAGKNRIAAGILKLADKNLDAIDGLIEKGNQDSRDIMMWAEYPRCSKISFDGLSQKQMKQIFIDDFIEYTSWLKK